MRRVVITGMGVVSPIGNTVDEILNSIKSSTCGIKPIKSFDTTDFKVKLAAEVENVNFDDYFSPRDLKFNDRFTQFARVAAKQAIANSGLVMEEDNNVSIILGSGIGGLASIENASKTIETRGPSRISPYFIPMSLINLAAGAIAIDHNCHGMVHSVVTACAAATDAIGLSFHHIKNGYSDVVISGGCEAAITPVGIGGFMAMRALSESTDPNRASIPFDKERSGFVMGEGAAVLVLEELEHAKARNATILAEVIGYGTTCDANHITAPSPGGIFASKAMKLALKDAGISSNDIDYINAHGTSTPLNDKTETSAINNVFTHKPFVSSTKSMSGHLLGTSGALEALICVLSLQNGILPATINHREADEECNLNLVLNEAKEADITIAMSNSLGFGGHNASIILKKWSI